MHCQDANRQTAHLAPSRALGVPSSLCRHCTQRRGALCAAQPKAQKATRRKDALSVNDIELYSAARQYAQAIEEGELSEDTIVANIMGSKNKDELTGAQAEYLDQIKAAVKKKAKEVEESHEGGRREYKMGCHFYGHGEYPKAEQYFLQARELSTQFSKLGGEIQIQLALAQSANGKDEECIETFKWIEQNHPLRKVKQQAQDLRYIMEAPKLPINDDERIMMPSMSGMSPNRGSSRNARSPARGKVSEMPQREKTWQEQFWDEYKPPAYVRNKYVWWAWGFVFLLGTYFSIAHRDWFS